MQTNNISRVFVKDDNAGLCGHRDLVGATLRSVILSLVESIGTHGRKHCFPSFGGPGIYGAAN